MWHQVKLVPCHTSYSLQPLTIHVVLKPRHISCIRLSHPHAKVHKYLFQLLHSIKHPTYSPCSMTLETYNPWNPALCGENSRLVDGVSCASRHCLFCNLQQTITSKTYFLHHCHPPVLWWMIAFDQDSHAWMQIQLSRGPFAFFAADCHNSLWATFSNNVVGSVASPVT